MPGLAKPFPETSASPMQARAHRANRNPECDADLGVVQVGPRVQQQDIALTPRQLRDGLGQACPQVLGIDARHDFLGSISDSGGHLDAGHRP